MPRLNRREFLGICAVAVLSDSAAGSNRNSLGPALKPFSFYAMDTGLRGPDVLSLEDKVKALHDLGYWGIDYTLNHDELPGLLELLNKYDVQLACVYLSPKLEDEIDPRLPESVKRMSGRPTRIELAIGSTRLKASDASGDGRAVQLLRRVSDMASDLGPVVSVYPHTGQWAERVEDGVRLAEKCGRKNVGTNFNLVHWKWVKQVKPQEQLIREAMPHLFAVSINGLRGHDIVPLDQGDYDVAGFLKRLKDAGYQGPVGLQGYGIPGSSRENLKRSMEKWREIRSSLHID